MISYPMLMGGSTGNPGVYPNPANGLAAPNYQSAHFGNIKTDRFNDCRNTPALNPFTSVNTQTCQSSTPLLADSYNQHPPNHIAASPDDSGKPGATPHTYPSTAIPVMNPAQQQQQQQQQFAVPSNGFTASATLGYEFPVRYPSSSGFNEQRHFNAASADYNRFPMNAPYGIPQEVGRPSGLLGFYGHPFVAWQPNVFSGQYLPHHAPIGQLPMMTSQGYLNAPAPELSNESNVSANNRSSSTAMQNTNMNNPSSNDQWQHNGLLALSRHSTASSSLVSNEQHNGLLAMNRNSASSSSLGSSEERTELEAMNRHSTSSSAGTFGSPPMMPTPKAAQRKLPKLENSASNSKMRKRKAAQSNETQSDSAISAPDRVALQPVSEAFVPSAIARQEIGTTPTSSENSNADSDNTTNGVQKISSRVKPKKVLKRPATSVPEELKDESYWDKRKKNNESAKRSRLGVRTNEAEAKQNLEKLQRENDELKADVAAYEREIEQLRSAGVAN